MFAGAGCAIDGTTPRALRTAEALAAALGMRADARRPTRTASPTTRPASIASNFLVTLEGAAERLAATAGVDRELLAPLVRAAVENWAGAAPSARSPARSPAATTTTVARQRAAVAERTPDLLPLFDALVERHPRARRAMRTLRTIAEMRAYVVRGPQRRARASGSSRRWAPSTPAITR